MGPIGRGGGEGEGSLTPWGYLTPRKKIASIFLA